MATDQHAPSLLKLFLSVNVSMLVYVCVHLRALITSGVIWCDIVCM